MQKLVLIVFVLMLHFVTQKRLPCFQRKTYFTLWIFHFTLEYLTPCQKTAWIKDGVCDKDEAEFKMEACQFDGGDCCQKSLIGNGICEEANNFASCGNFDGGDCKGKMHIVLQNNYF